MTDEEIVAALVETLDNLATGLWMGPGWGRLVADELLAVVRRVAEQRAAEALDDLAERFRELGQIGAYCVVKARLDARAAALTATPHHGRNAT